MAVNHLAPISSEMARLMDDPVEIDRLLNDGAMRADTIAAPILKKVKNAVGMIV